MLILEDERKIKQEKICENCKQLASGRLIESFGYYTEGRGHFFICFECFGPRIKWTDGNGKRVYWSPIPA